MHILHVIVRCPGRVALALGNDDGQVVGDVGALISPKLESNNAAVENAFALLILLLCRLLLVHRRCEHTAYTIILASVFPQTSLCPTPPAHILQLLHLISHTCHGRPSIPNH